MGNRIKIIDSSGQRFPKKLKINVTEFTVDNNNIFSKSNTINYGVYDGNFTPDVNRNLNAGYDYGSNYEIQFNDKGNFGASHNLIFDPHQGNFLQKNNYLMLLIGA